MPFLNMLVTAFLSSKPSLTVHHEQRSPQVLFVIRNDDFARIFGEKEATERQIRDLAREYHPLPKNVVYTLYNTSVSEGNLSRGRNRYWREQCDEEDEYLDASEENKNATIKLKKKYVPPPHL